MSDGRTAAGNLGAAAGEGGPAAGQPVPDAHGELLDLAVAAAGIGTFDWDLSTGTLHWDDRLLELFGLDEAEFDRSIEGFNACLYPSDLGRVTTLLQRAIDECGDYEAEYRILRADGSVRWVAARGRALCDEQGVTDRLLGAAWDVTDRRHADDRVDEILEDMTVGFIAMDRNWTITLVNAEGERMAGQRRADLVGTTFWAAFPATVGSEFEERYRRATATGETVAFDAFYPEPLNIWVEVRAVPSAGGLQLYFLDITERIRLQQRSELLARVTRELTGTLDAEEAVAHLADLVVPALADWCLVSLVEDDQQTNFRRRLRDVGSAHVDPDQRALLTEYAALRIPALQDGSFVERALTSGRPVVVPRAAARQIGALFPAGRAQDLIEQLGPEACAVLPLRGRGRTAGLLTLFVGPGRGGLSAQDLDTAAEIAARAGLALDNARLYREQRGLAEGLQRSLLTPPPEPDHLQVVVRYAPAAQAAQVGGDWYDAFVQPGGATVLVIGDVVGHDIQAAAAMGQIRSIVRTLGAAEDHGPADVLQRTDTVMETLMLATVATVAIARLEATPDERRRGVTRLRWCNAGHPPPFLIGADGAVRPLSAPRADLLLGVTPDTRRREHELLLDRDSVVILYTDGLVERRGQDLDAGLRRLQDTLEELAGRDLDELCDALLARMLPDDADDDVAIVAVRLHPEDRPRPAEAGPEVVPSTVPGSPGVVRPT